MAIKLNANRKIVCRSASEALAAARNAKAEGHSTCFEVVDGIYGRSFHVVVSL